MLRLLGRLQGQMTDRQFSLSAVVVDNDIQESGRQAVQMAREQSTFPIDYHVEPERSISLARNRSVEGATGNLIAFIDDDEYPEERWLLNAFKTLRDSGASGILGPVRPSFDDSAPAWLVKSGLSERKEFPTGWVMNDARHTRTGNALLWSSIFCDKENRFDPVYGKAGGGDAVFFKRMMERGHVFIWCNEAVVFETVTPERYKKSYYIKRAFTRGMTEALETRFLSFGTLRSAVAIPVYSAALPFALLAGPHVFMRYLTKECDHLAKILAYLGIKPIRERPY